MAITRDFDLYLNAGRTTAVVINVNQYDSGETWRFSLYTDDGQAYTPTDVAIIGTKSDGKMIANAGTVSNGKAVITETEQMTAAAGKAVFELIVDGETHGTANFIVLVEESPTENGIASDSDLSLFEQAIGGISSAHIAEAVSAWMDENLTPTTPVVDKTLSIEGAAADAKKTGDEISQLKSAISSSTGMSAEFKAALEKLLEHVAYTDEHGQEYLDALHAAMYPPANLTSITAVFNQADNIIYDTDSLDSLKQYLTVTAYYDDGTNSAINTYALSGTLAEGTSTITVAYGGKTTTFSVTVTKTNVLYKLPQATTFNGTSDYIDTELKLNQQDIDYTILGHFYIERNANNFNVVMHCMRESNPYPGSLIDVPQAGVRFGFGSANIQSQLGIKGYPNDVKFAITHQKGSGVYTVETLNNGTRKTDSASWTFVSVTQNMLLGAYQTTAGAKGRYLQGTIYDFCVYGEVLSSDRIDSYFAS